jgi:hypothetical protein
MIVISTDIQQLPEKGEAYLIDINGNVIFHFFDGNTEKEVLGNYAEEITLAVA